MSTHNIPFSIKKIEKSHSVILNLQPRDFFQGLENEFETAVPVVNEPSVFEPLKFYCIHN